MVMFAPIREVDDYSMNIKKIQYGWAISIIFVDQLLKSITVYKLISNFFNLIVITMTHY